MKRYFVAAAFISITAIIPNTEAISISGSVGGIHSGVKRLNFDDLTPGQSGTFVTATPNGFATVTITSDGQVASGSASGLYAAPYLSGNNGVGFGIASTTQENGVDATPYLTTGIASVKIDFGSDQLYMGLLWGSIDDYNTLEFYTESGVLVDSVTGSQVVASPNGDQGLNGTLYVNIDTSAPFRYAIAKSSSYAFEFDNVAYNDQPITRQTINTPDGGSVTGVFAAVVGVLAIVRRGRLLGRNVG